MLVCFNGIIGLHDFYVRAVYGASCTKGANGGGHSTCFRIDTNLITFDSYIFNPRSHSQRIISKPRDAASGLDPQPHHFITVDPMSVSFLPDRRL